MLVKTILLLQGVFKNISTQMAGVFSKYTGLRGSLGVQRSLGTLGIQGSLGTLGMHGTLGTLGLQGLLGILGM